MTAASGAADAFSGRCVEAEELRPAAPGPLAAGAPAGLGRRSAAAAIDALVLTLLLFAESWVLLAVFGLKVGRDLGAADAPYFAVAAVIAWLYCAGFDSGRRGATPGKRAMGIEVLDLTGERPGFARATLRFLARTLTVASFMLGWLLIPATRRRQALHDLVAGTVVVRSGRPE